MEREEVRFVVGGTRCAAWLFRPSGTAAGACVVMGSGLSCVRDQGLDAFGERFAAAGLRGPRLRLPPLRRQRRASPARWSAARVSAQDLRAALAFAGPSRGSTRRASRSGAISLGGANVQALAIAEPGIAAAICVAPLVNGIRSLLHIGGPGHARPADAAPALGTGRGRSAEPSRTGYRQPARRVRSRSSTPPTPSRASRRSPPPDSSWRTSSAPASRSRPRTDLARKVRRIALPDPLLHRRGRRQSIHPTLGSELTRQGASPTASSALIPRGVRPFSGP